jgi:hypothetical protein
MTISAPKQVTEPKLNGSASLGFALTSPLIAVRAARRGRSCSLYRIRTRRLWTGIDPSPSRSETQ